MNAARTSLLALAVLAPLTLAACSGGDEPAPQSTSTVAVSSAAAGSQASSSPDGQVSTPQISTPQISTMDPTATGSASMESVADQATASASPTASIDTTGLKKAATAKLPEKVGSYTGKVDGDATAQAGLYTGSTEDDMVMAALNTSSDGSALAATLQSQQKTEHATCGTLQQVAYCVIPLDGGHIALNGSNETKVSDLASFADQIYAALA